MPKSKITSLNTPQSTDHDKLVTPAIKIYEEFDVTDEDWEKYYRNTPSSYSSSLDGLKAYSDEERIIAELDKRGSNDSDIFGDAFFEIHLTDILKKIQVLDDDLTGSVIVEDPFKHFRIIDNKEIDNYLKSLKFTNTKLPEILNSIFSLYLLTQQTINKNVKLDKQAIKKIWLENFSNNTDFYTASFNEKIIKLKFYCIKKGISFIHFETFFECYEAAYQENKKYTLDREDRDLLDQMDVFEESETELEDKKKCDEESQVPKANEDSFIENNFVYPSEKIIDKVKNPNNEVKLKKNVFVVNDKQETSSKINLTIAIKPNPKIKEDKTFSQTDQQTKQTELSDTETLTPRTKRTVFYTLKHKFSAMLKKSPDKKSGSRATVAETLTSSNDFKESDETVKKKKQKGKLTITDFPVERLLPSDENKQKSKAPRLSFFKRKKEENPDTPKNTYRMTMEKSASTESFPKKDKENPLPGERESVSASSFFRNSYDPKSENGVVEGGELSRRNSKQQ